MSQQPNILLLMTDQHRGDALGIEDHPCLQTPYLDHLASSGVRFAKAYSACPVSIPARRTMLTGCTPATHGVFMNHHTWLNEPTFPQLLSDAGYQTHLCGKIHTYPLRRRYGFDSADWSDMPRAMNDCDYTRFLKRQGLDMPQIASAHGCDQNGYVVRPWHLPEHLHFSNWVTDAALRFLERRDPTVPFLLNASYVHPHQPCTPPQVYYDRYMQMDLPEPVVGDWARVYDEPHRGSPVAAWRLNLPTQQQKQLQAAYFGSINHIDDQIGRILEVLPQNTVVIFLSDHGEMLGDHQWLRKRTPFEPSARVPMIWNFPDTLGVAQQQVKSEVVELMDVAPTLLELAGAKIPPHMDGQSLLPLIRGEGDWRQWIHGECSSVPSVNSGMQYLTDGKTKYIYWPGTGQEQLFDLVNDPNEMHDLMFDNPGDPEVEKQVAPWRQRLIEILKDRPEGFVQDGTLSTLGSDTPATLPGCDQKSQNQKHHWNT